MQRRSVLAAPLLLPWLLPITAAAPAPPSVAVFGFSLDNTSPADSTPEELARTQRIGRAFAAALQQSGLYSLVDMAPASALLRGQPDIFRCNGCELQVAARLGARLAAYGWIQKVSNLILNLNVVIEDAKTGRHIKAGSVDIRGNTDESWDRGLKFLLEEHVFPSDLTTSDLTARDLKPIN